MRLDVLDAQKLERQGCVDAWVSLYWDEPYNTEGSFTLEVRPTAENLALLQEGCWVKRSDRQMPMRICHRTNANEDKNLVCTGSPATWILTKRVSTAIVKAENAEAAMRRLVAEMEPWPRLELGELVGFDTTYTQQTSGGTIMDYIQYQRPDHQPSGGKSTVHCRRQHRLRRKLCGRLRQVHCR